MYIYIIFYNSFIIKFKMNYYLDYFLQPFKLIETKDTVRNSENVEKENR